MGDEQREQEAWLVKQVGLEIAYSESHPSVFCADYCKTLALNLSESGKKQLAKEFRYRLPVLLWYAFIFIGENRLGINEVDAGLNCNHILPNDPCFEAMREKVTKTKLEIIDMAVELGVWGR